MLAPSSTFGWNYRQNSFFVISRQLIVDLVLRDVVGVALNPVCRLHRVISEHPGPKTSGLEPPREALQAYPAYLAFMPSRFSDIGERTCLQSGREVLVELGR
jgi:hypothetical protein